MLACLFFFFFFLLLTLLQSPATSFRVSRPAVPSVVLRADMSFHCPCVDHWFKHNRHWIRASSTTGCMSLETVPDNIYLLNALLKPDYVSNDFPTLICSLNQNRCGWAYSPLESLRAVVTTTSSILPYDDVNGTAEETPACEEALDTMVAHAEGFVESTMA
ncbi:hypothetical protein AYL99_09014 [Fonsecaea erecta]|uniref:Uncharacterized protein n=1 Tax=Fonsecaea erecta TaxID=1367422 RepID=A0A178ZB71_9EURO|nr:hypothetical protein AYL99_09014 [Fonsecaea erecta]OAP56902.1 hypothetical protein AYL99_09014 [Fonsecaea erecta]